MTKIVLATRNPGKLREIRELCAVLSQPPVATIPQIEWLSLDAYAHIPDAVESGETFAENARIKAVYYAQATGLHCLADDSGLVVDALNGRPGVHSARFAGEPKSDEANNRKLLSELGDVPPEKRTARFCCAMAFAEMPTPAQAPRVFVESAGTVEGRIIDDPRGCNGFGYDPLFFIPGLARTLAELPSEEKNALSHRGGALRGILPKLVARFRELRAN